MAIHFTFRRRFICQLSLGAGTLRCRTAHVLAITVARQLKTSANVPRRAGLGVHPTVGLPEAVCSIVALESAAPTSRRGWQKATYSAKRNALRMIRAESLLCVDWTAHWPTMPEFCRDANEPKESQASRLWEPGFFYTNFGLILTGSCGVRSAEESHERGLPRYLPYLTLGSRMHAI